MATEPTIEIEHLVESVDDFEAKLIHGTLPMPFWLKVGKDSFRVSGEMKISTVMRMCICVRHHFKA